ncbi:PAS domain-containing protein [Phyllobacterium sp. 0TCS1.6C]|uniref:PAS domain-containing protein n=1 Tax=unclassified Phyllobacterium TaxID=2638441 RepID=UPI00226484E4|nr:MULTISPECIES: PAS domain-containing protein [unclassified Phyllobacterium]MCX8281009.1 PAS domain-containing protein [Phyllobacterium sp. 0TCS1.6C]MCX8295875.1 PAS domain-containing protein [Phyllobacterium sp. 0TCS1.6A]
MTDVPNIRLHSGPNVTKEDAEANRWSFALESAGLGVWDSNLVTGQCYYSPTWKRMLGYRPEELGDRSDLWLTLIHPDDRLRAVESGERHVKGLSDSVETEFRLRHKDGYWVWVLDRGRVVEWDADGKPTRMIGVQTDITSQKQVESQLKFSNERVQLALDAGQIGLWEFDPATETVYWDRRMREIFGLPPGERTIARETWHELLHPDDAASAEAQIESTLETGQPAKMRYRIVKPDGDIRHVIALARRVTHGASTLLMGSIWDVTDEVVGAEALAREKELYRITLNSIGDAVLTTDVENRITFANPAAESLLLKSKADLIGETVDAVFALRDELTGEPVLLSSMLAIRSGRTVEGAENNLLFRPDGERRALRNLASPLFDLTGRITGAVLIVQDITAARQLQRQLAHAASHDPLTGLSNRIAFETAATSALARLAAGVQYGLYYIDLDHFKSVNDTYGHAAGDKLLKSFAEILLRILPHGAIAGRLGGDEFAVLVAVGSEGDAIALANELVGALGVGPANPSELRDVGASIGVTLLGDGAITLGEALAQADAACYTAKAQGRNRVALYRPTPSS